MDPRTRFSMGSLRLVAALALLTPGCMLGPYDGQVVPSRDAPIRFHGFHLYADREITLQTWNPRDGDFDAFATARTARTSSVTFDSYPLYSWSRDVRIPAAQWQPGYRGYTTVVRAVWRPVTGYVDLDLRDGGMLHVGRDWFECAQEHDTVEAFRAHCSRGAWIPIHTEDYCAQFEPRAPALRAPRASLAVRWDPHTRRITNAWVQVPLVDGFDAIPRPGHMATDTAIDGAPLTGIFDHHGGWHVVDFLADRGIDDVCEAVRWVEGRHRLTGQLRFNNGPNCSPPLDVDVPIVELQSDMSGEPDCSP